MGKCENCQCGKRAEKDLIQVCESKTCRPKYSREVMRGLEKHFEVQEAHENDCVRLEYRGCLGYCQEANNVAVNGNILSNVLPEEAIARVEEARGRAPGDYTKGEFKDLDLDDIFLGLK